MKSIFAGFIALLLSHISATCTPTSELHNVTHQAREAETCADPSLTTAYISAFSIARTAHVVRARTAMIAYDTNTANHDNWQFQNTAFLAWLNIQEFTVPFYQMVNTNTDDDYNFLPAVNGGPPTAAGFSVQGIAGYAYTTQICGSVPLLSAVNAAASDHWWTTNPNDHADVLASGTGWVDGGVAFYVLPLDSA